MSRRTRRRDDRSARPDTLRPAVAAPRRETDPAPKRRGPEPRGGEDVRRVTIRLSALEYAGAAELARQRAVTVSDVVRDALIEQLIGQIGHGRAGGGVTAESDSSDVSR